MDDLTKRAVRREKRPCTHADRLVYRSDRKRHKNNQPGLSAGLNLDFNR